jgi:NTE family protein
VSPLNNDYGTAIVLQGGGALGAYELGVLKALYEERPGFKPAVITGVSIGAITAAVLAGAKGDPIQALDRLWREKLTVLPPVPPFFQSAYHHFVPRKFEQSLAVMGNPGMYQLRPQSLYAPLVGTSIYDTAPLRRTLAELVDLEKLNNGGIRVAVGATNVGTSDVKYFDNVVDNDLDDNDEGRLSFEDVIASGSLPPGFPMTKVNGDYYWDGGLFSNTPLSPALNRLEEIETDKRELVVIELFPREIPLPDNLPDVMNRMVQLQFTNRLKLDEKLFETMNDFVELVERIDKSVDPKDDIRQEEGYKKLRKHKKIDAASIIRANLPHELTNAGDFSKASIEERIEVGYRDAMEQKIGEYTPTKKELARVKVE